MTNKTTFLLGFLVWGFLTASSMQAAGVKTGLDIDDVFPIQTPTVAPTNRATPTVVPAILRHDPPTGPSNRWLSDSVRQAVGFTTSQTYDVQQLIMDLSKTGSSVLTVSIVGDSGGAPDWGNVIGTFSGPTVTTRALYTFTPDGSIILQAGQTYWIGGEGTGDGSSNRHNWWGFLASGSGAQAPYYSGWEIVGFLGTTTNQTLFMDLQGGLTTPTPTSTPTLPYTPTPTPTPICVNHGDVNFSGDYTAGDAQLAFLIVVSLYLPTFEEECAADCNGDGSVTAGDAQQIFGAVFGGSCEDPLPVLFDAACPERSRWAQGDNIWEVDQKISSEDRIWLEVHDDVMETVMVDVMIANETVQIDAFTIDLSIAPGWVFTDCMEGDSGGFWFEFECREVNPGRITVAAYTIPTAFDAVVREGSYCSLVRMVFNTPLSREMGNETPVEIIGIFDDLGRFMKSDTVWLE